MTAIPVAQGSTLLNFATQNELSSNGVHHSETKQSDQLWWLSIVLGPRVYSVTFCEGPAHLLRPQKMRWVWTTRLKVVAHCNNAAFQNIQQQGSDSSGSQSNTQRLCEWLVHRCRAISNTPVSFDPDWLYLPWHHRLFFSRLSSPCRIRQSVLAWQFLFIQTIVKLKKLLTSHICITTTLVEWSVFWPALFASRKRSNQPSLLWSLDISS